MSLSEPLAPSTGGVDAAPAADEDDFICNTSETLFVAIEKCLDNGLGACLVVDGERLLGRISLDEIARAVREGALLNPGLDHFMATFADRRRNDGALDKDVLRPVVDDVGRLLGVNIDRSAQFVQIARPDMSHDEFRSLLDAFLSSWISSKGPYVEKFEDEFRTFVGAQHGVAVSNGTEALHLALVALGIGPGHEVIVPDLTFAATINAVLYCGATPVIVDVDRDTWCLGLEEVKAACTPRTRAIIPVHLYGRPAEIGPIARFARERGIFVIEDCAEAHGASYENRPVGQFGDVGCFSFYANKIVTTGEGGMCLTGDPEIATSLRVLRDHGITPNRSYWHERVGFNYRITNLQAAIGHSQLWRIDGILARNAAIARRYENAMKDIPGVSFPPPMDARCAPVVWLACVQVPQEARNEILSRALEARLEMRPFFHSLSSLPPYEAFAAHCPNSAHLAATGINLPTQRAVDEQVVARVAEVFRAVLT
ncbi:MAG: aminotransferase class I/II-fold pyridoxal phosphate-dependent enzyme [Reyranella sp.]|nr:aminotransferase class I/II-fold pyridoxal phosphate-dependent enzyme [Reyranella sp.]